jgi:hypothetical protein
MNEKIENAVPLSHQRIVIEAGRTVQIYIRHDDAHGTRALCEIVGPAIISCAAVERSS